MKTSRVLMLVAAVSFATGSLISAQGRGHGPAGGVPQIARGGGSGPSVTGGGSGGRGNPGATTGNRGGGKNAGGNGRANDGGGGGNGGGPPANVGGGSGNAGGRGRENGGGQPGENPGAGRGHAGGKGRGNAGAGGSNENGDEGDQGEGGHGRGASSRENGGSFAAKMNPNQRARLEAMLPSGMTLEQAAEGFRNQGQFIAALQQSKSHNISFADLKAEMTGDNPVSLGQAMRKFRVDTDED